MITDPGFPGAAFGTAADGDGRSDEAARESISAALDIPTGWAWALQVHGGDVAVVRTGGSAGKVDGLVTLEPRLPLTIATADCLPVILGGQGGVGIAHAGWRGAAAGVVGRVRNRLADLGVDVQWAAIGPGIGPCCFEVGPEVAADFPGSAAQTAWRTRSVDLVDAVGGDLGGLEVWRVTPCTHHESGFHSHRRNGTPLRQVAVAWLS